jgi:hypothetical protein
MTGRMQQVKEGGVGKQNGKKAGYVRKKAAICGNCYNDITSIWQFNKIWCKYHTTRGHSTFIIFHLLPSKILAWWQCKLPSW